MKQARLRRRGHTVLMASNAERQRAYRARQKGESGGAYLRHLQDEVERLWALVQDQQEALRNVTQYRNDRYVTDADSGPILPTDSSVIKGGVGGVLSSEAHWPSRKTSTALQQKPSQDRDGARERAHTGEVSTVTDRNGPLQRNVTGAVVGLLAPRTGLRPPGGFSHAEEKKLTRQDEPTGDDPVTGACEGTPEPEQESGTRPVDEIPKLGSLTLREPSDWGERRKELEERRESQKRALAALGEAWVKQANGTAQ